MDKKINRKIKAMRITQPDWKQNSECYIFVVTSNFNFDTDKSELILKSWAKVDWFNPEKTPSYNIFKMIATANNGKVFGVWLPKELSEIIDKNDNPEEYLDLIMKYKFQI